MTGLDVSAPARVCEWLNIPGSGSNSQGTTSYDISSKICVCRNECYFIFPNTTFFGFGDFCLVSVQ